MNTMRLTSLFAVLLLILGLFAVACGGGADDDDDDVANDDDTVANQTPCADDSFDQFDCDPMTQEPCNVGSGEACDVAFDNQTVVEGFACYRPPNNVPVGGVCNSAEGPWCVRGASCVAVDKTGSTFICATFCCSDTECVGSATCQVTGRYGPAASDLGVCL
jgi:hypothetical protein